MRILTRHHSTLMRFNLVNTAGLIASLRRGQSKLHTATGYRDVKSCGGTEGPIPARRLHTKAYWEVGVRIGPLGLVAENHGRRKLVDVK